jgi:hypothetical protein
MALMVASSSSGAPVSPVAAGPLAEGEVAAELEEDCPEAAGCALAEAAGGALDGAEPAAETEAAKVAEGDTEAVDATGALDAAAPDEAPWPHAVKVSMTAMGRNSRFIAASRDRKNYSTT